ncbi:MAG TPA: cellulase N-terminal Ig-like domain-containing protein, partial [Pyrinomonadaceae bacterium]|nr:cellulase N-terminal Ig-like domain-containing protein [Pyrinomonadaceae bacterium]
MALSTLPNICGSSGVFGRLQRPNSSHCFSRSFASGYFLWAALRPSAASVAAILFCNFLAFGHTTFIRVNQAGYLPDEKKTAIAFSRAPVADEYFLVRDSMGNVVWTGRVKAITAPAWGPAFPHYYELDFSGMSAEGSGTHTLQLVKAGVVSREFNIGPYPRYHEDLLHFMRQQRCGYNPFLDMVCHQRDGRSFYGPIPDETFVDV